MEPLKVSTWPQNAQSVEVAFAYQSKSFGTPRFRHYLALRIFNLDCRLVRPFGTGFDGLCVMPAFTLLCEPVH